MYTDLGIPTYLLVDPTNETVEWLMLNPDGVYEPSASPLAYGDIKPR